MKFYWEKLQYCTYFATISYNSIESCVFEESLKSSLTHCVYCWGGKIVSHANCQGGSEIDAKSALVVTTNQILPILLNVICTRAWSFCNKYISRSTAKYYLKIQTTYKSGGIFMVCIPIKFYFALDLGFMLQQIPPNWASHWSLKLYSLIFFCYLSFLLFPFTLSV